MLITGPSTSLTKLTNMNDLKASKMKDNMQKGFSISNMQIPRNCQTCTMTSPIYSVTHIIRSIYTVSSTTDLQPAYPSCNM
ncbi:hypothetical protein HanRHA438_Chr11g0486391 [Helianthus annuus]|nr:hypothetical protein HanHA300_Chr11g0388331 [Helianthus annuus]KAJ0507730.1 hypothetical protein HanIR_Chr11g0509411 [Helianthus annuus]KAJ0516160.1 hypothetical protein HanHA89_Chr11g0410701 [Helianthus annuus]KAJ0684186.1 hypothetical protein HanLR1_Chr11g0388391 [Helianthus annuus]KAJ0869188.1 hypothetical protein HanRHA438_Chr11g0486391 [Helianthus annuus]